MLSMKCCDIFKTKKWRLSPAMDSRCPDKMSWKKSPEPASFCGMRREKTGATVTISIIMEDVLLPCENHLLECFKCRPEPLGTNILYIFFASNRRKSFVLQKMP